MTVAQYKTIGLLAEPIQLSKKLLGSPHPSADKAGLDWSLLRHTSHVCQVGAPNGRDELPSSFATRTPRARQVISELLSSGTN